MTSLPLAYEEYGDHSNDPLIILHGFFASSRNWKQMAKRFAESFHVYVLDLRNHGASPHAPVMDYPLMTEDLNIFMENQELQQANILGHSMGGKVAMYFALTYPNKVNHLIIADISPVSYQHNFDQTIIALQEIPLDQIANRKQADDLLSANIPEHAYRQFLLQNLVLINGQYSWRINLDFFLKSAQNITAFPSTNDIDQHFLGKTFFIMGGNSTYTNRQAIEKKFPNANISILEKANHWLHVDEPDAFFSQIMEFLQKK